MLLPVVESAPVEAAKLLVPRTLELLSVTTAAVSVTFALPDVFTVSVPALLLLAVTLPEPFVRYSVPADARELPLAVSIIFPVPLAFSVRSPLVVVTDAFIPTAMLPLLAVLSEEVPFDITVPLTVSPEPEFAARGPVVRVPPSVIAPAEDN